jgi:hypothetical protein
MTNLSRGKYAQFISDRSGMAFPYKEMVVEWNGARVHVSEFEPKQPQLNPKPAGTDAQGLQFARPDRVEPPVTVLLIPNPFETVIYAGNTYINVNSQNHGLSTGNLVRFRGTVGNPPTPPIIVDPTNDNDLYYFEPIPIFDGVSDIDNANGFTITVGKINSSGIVGDTLNYYFFQSSDTATVGNVQGGGTGCSSGPVTLRP